MNREPVLNLQSCFANLPVRRKTGSLKWDVHPDDELLPLWVADMDFLSPPAVIRALHERVEHGVFGYSYPMKSQTDAVVNWLEQRHQWTLDPNWIQWTPGLVPALHAICRTFAGNTGKIIVPSPIYPPFLEAPELAGCEALRVPFLEEEDGWVPDLERMQKYAEEGADLLMLCNPHNPLGRMYRKEELQFIAELCVKHDMILCSDEVHCDLVLDSEKHIISATLSDEIRERTITLMGATKTFNIAGLGCAWIVTSNQELRKSLAATMKGIVGDVNPMGFVATEAALSEGEAWRQELLAVLRKNRDLVETYFRDDALPISMKPVEAGYLAWLDVREMQSVRPCSSLQKQGVWLSDGETFGGSGFLRLNYGCETAILNEALARISRWAE